MRQHAEAEANWQSRHATIEQQHAATREQLSAVSVERDTLLRDKSSIQSDLLAKESAVADVEKKLADVTAQLSNSARQLQQTEAELRTAKNRAEEAERIQGELQAEGTSLMRSLDEMRSKIVELTDDKLNLGEKSESLENALRSRDSTIAQMESTLDELRAERDRAEKDRQDLAAMLERERMSSHETSSDLQKAYTELKVEAEAMRAAIRDLENERTNYHQMADRHFAEVDRFTSSLQSHTEQLSSLRNELEERQRAQHEVQEFLERAQSEMEALRAELSAKDEEIERLREAASVPSTPSPHSLDEEMLSALKQQHTLELSAAQSQIRSLETSMFEAEARVHSFQRQITILEDQLAHFRSTSRTSQRSPLPHRLVDHSDELRRASFTSHKPSHVTATPTFEGLSPEAQHKRRVSLSMLKARIDSEVAASTNMARSSSKAASPLTRTATLPTVNEPASPLGSATPRKPQFMDDAHIFWCHCCQGDLVIL